MRHKKKHVLVVMPVNLPWDWTTDFYEQTARELSADHTVICVFTGEIPTIRHLITGSRRGAIIEKLAHQIIGVRPVDIIPFRRFRFIQNLNVRISYGIIREAIRMYALLSGYDEIVIWAFEADAYPFVAAVKPLGRVIYDNVDYFDADGFGDRKSDVIRYHTALLKTSDLVTANSRVLLRNLSKIRQDIRLVPQGFRLDSFRTVAVNNNSGNKKTVGYIGGLNSRIDFVLLERVIRLLPDVRFLFAGQFQSIDNQESAVVIRRKIHKLRIYKNFSYVGNIRKQQIPAFLKTLTAGLIPYREDMNFNIYSFPMKVFEYFYAGLPVISTDIRELRNYPEFIYVGSDAHEWVTHIRTLTGSKWPIRKIIRQRQIAEAHSWSNKVQRVLESL